LTTRAPLIWYGIFDQTEQIALLFHERAIPSKTSLVILVYVVEITIILSMLQRLAQATSNKGYLPANNLAGLKPRDQERRRLIERTAVSVCLLRQNYISTTTAAVGRLVAARS
jgi:hypothetical protein